MRLISLTGADRLLFGPLSTTDSYLSVPVFGVGGYCPPLKGSLQGVVTFYVSPSYKLLSQFTTGLDEKWVPFIGTDQ